MTELTVLAQWSPIVGVIGLLGALMLYLYVSKQSSGTELMGEVSARIQEGAMAFLRREYSVLAVFVMVVAVLLFFAIGGATAVAYVSGALSSVLAGFFGMSAATRANVRTAAAAKESGSGKALRMHSSAARSWVCRSPRLACSGSASGTSSMGRVRPWTPSSSASARS